MQNSTFTLKSITSLASTPVLAIALISGFPALAYGDEITATIEDWPHGDADIVPMMVPRIIGRIDADGAVHIELPPNYTQKMVEETEAENAGDSEFSVSMRPAGEAWGCDTGGLETQNGDRFAAGLSNTGAFYVGSMAKDVGYGTLMMSNSSEFAERYDPFSGTAARGFYVDWVHAETDITISGDCKEVPVSIPGGDGELEAVTSYRIELVPGWNLLKYEIEEVHETDSGMVLPKKATYSTIDTLPDDAEFVFVSD